VRVLSRKSVLDDYKTVICHSLENSDQQALLCEALTSGHYEKSLLLENISRNPWVCPAPRFTAARAISSPQGNSDRRRGRLGLLHGGFRCSKTLRQPRDQSRR